MSTQSLHFTFLLHWHLPFSLYWFHFNLNRWWWYLFKRNIHILLRPCLLYICRWLRRRWHRVVGKRIFLAVAYCLMYSSLYICKFSKWLPSLSLSLFFIINKLRPSVRPGSRGVFNSRIKFTCIYCTQLDTHTEEEKREKPVYDLEGVSFSLSRLWGPFPFQVSRVIDFNFVRKEKKSH